MGFFDKLFSGLSKTRANMEELEEIFKNFSRWNDAEFYEELEEMLLMSDMSWDVVDIVIKRLRARVTLDELTRGDQVKKALTGILSDILAGQDTSLKLGTKPSVILMTGVNGVGKTTTIGKLALMLKNEGKKVLLCAGDTFRAAAAEQLGIWAERSGSEIVAHEEGSDPAAVVFDSIAAAKARGSDVIIVDTAGRLHNKQNLMNELAKIGRVIRRELPEADIETLMVLDATTGQNGLEQAKQFLETAELTGIVLTKLDGTAKGGIVYAIASQLKVPVKFIGVGEGVEDLLPFDPKSFSEALFE
ncbi:MAG: signal recognition particle-docking protein FtsY [Oscillospiraceae bacterium]|jgi:fused signal recognition particle receptor|nr:signal recognition particle-docking protein FtsY [Oscillospiraceae bacterium]MBQ2146527.1 signal recognition particle-docking protein FtsY [Oscillospiraceae bacterium]